MQRPWSSWWILLGGILAMTTSACSVFLDWDWENLPCDHQHKCLDGYACLSNQQCVLEHSVMEGGACQSNLHCEESLICAGGFCRQRCTSYYAGCQRGEYCNPVETETGVLGACVSEDGCNFDSDCHKAGKVCVQVTSTARVCMDGCEVTFNGSAPSFYNDNCASTTVKPRYCQPLGSDPNQQRLVCIDTVNNAQTEGSICAPGENPCQRGLACMGQRDVRICRRYCQPSTTDCGSTLNCQAHPTFESDAGYSVCE